MSKFTVLIIMVAGLLLAGCSVNTAPAPAPAQPAPTTAPDVATVEILFLNHGPVRGVLTDIDSLLEGYGEQIHVAHYDFNTPEGEAFAQSQGLSGHIPLVIFVNGSKDFTVGDRAVEFFSFPQGQGTGVVPDGAWSIADLQQVLDQVVEKG